MNSDGKFTSGQFAKLAGINRETVRFYERLGLLPAPMRSRGRYRIYGDKDLRRVTFILRAKNLGFPLSDIAELLAIADGRIVRCPEVKKVATKRLAQIESQIDALRRLKKSLCLLLDECDKARRIDGCPIIDALWE